VGGEEIKTTGTDRGIKGTSFEVPIGKGIEKPERGGSSRRRKKIAGPRLAS